MRSINLFAFKKVLIFCSTTAAVNPSKGHLTLVRNVTQKNDLKDHIATDVMHSETAKILKNGIIF